MSGISKWMQALHFSSQKFTPLHHHNIYHRCTAYWGMTSMSERTTEQEVCLCNINSLNRYWSQKHDIHSCREAKRQEQVALISPFFVSNNLCSDSGKLLRVREGGKSEESCLVGDVQGVDWCGIKELGYEREPSCWCSYQVIRRHLCIFSSQNKSLQNILVFWVLSFFLL